jgi:hypothetical protein
MLKTALNFKLPISLWKLLHYYCVIMTPAANGRQKLTTAGETGLSCFLDTPCPGGYKFR